MVRVRYVVASIIVVGIAIGAFYWGHNSESHANGSNSTTSSTLASAKGPIGPASGHIEYICTNATNGPGTDYSAAIAAVTNGSGTWTCPTSYFSQLGEVQVGGSFFCSVTVTETDGSPSPTANTYSDGPYPAKIGHFTAGGAVGTYYGAYCLAPLSNTFHIWASWPGSSTTYSMTTS